MGKAKTKRGSASLYSVVILMMFISVVVVGFITLMIPVIRRADRFNHSESAYESAMAGVEDAKYAIRYYKACKDGTKSGTTCNSVKNAFASHSQDCSFMRETGLFTTETEGDEIKIGSTVSGSRAFDQAYTCVNVNLNADDYVGTLEQGKPSRTIPLRTTNNGSAKYLRLSWFTNENLNGGTVSANKYLVSSKTPSSLRVEFAYHNASGGVVKALALSPSTSGTHSIGGMGSWSSSPYGIECNTDPTAYRCYVDIEITDFLATASSAASGFDPLVRVVLMDGKTATDFSLSVLDGSNKRIPLNGIQALIDVTGRSGTAYRRVQARLETDGADLLFMNYALSITGGGLDKSHLVTSGTCENLYNTITNLTTNGYNDIRTATLNIYRSGCSGYE